MDSTRALLDELMGKERNAPLSKRTNKDAHFSDPDVCKPFICGFCPNELFTNTKSDLGPCTKSHDDNIRIMYQEARDKDKYPYQKEFIRTLEHLVDDLDRRIKKGHDRLDVQDDSAEIPLTAENAEKVRTISAKIQDLLAKVESFGEEGKIDESQQLMLVVDKLKAEKEQVIQSNDIRPISSQEKRMKVCDICGAFLVVGDTDKRIQSHLEGKQHQGYALIRRTIQDYRKAHPNDEYDSDKDRRRDSRGGRDVRDNRGNRDRDRYSRGGGEKRDRYSGGGNRDRYDRDRDSRDRKRSRDSY
jgi:hypothetical protein